MRSGKNQLQLWASLLSLNLIDDPLLVALPYISLQLKFHAAWFSAQLSEALVSLAHTIQAGYTTAMYVSLCSFVSSWALAPRGDTFLLPRLSCSFLGSCTPNSSLYSPGSFFPALSITVGREKHSVTEKPFCQVA